jgi:hypothetical protein
MSPGKRRKVASESGGDTPQQLRSSMVYHPQKEDEQEVYDYDEELMHAQVPINN